MPISKQIVSNANASVLYAGNGFLEGGRIIMYISWLLDAFLRGLQGLGR